MAASELA